DAMVVCPARVAQVECRVDDKRLVRVVVSKVDHRDCVSSGEISEPVVVHAARLSIDTEIVVVCAVHGHAQDQRLASQFANDTQQQAEVGPLDATLEAAKDRLPRVKSFLPRDLRGALCPECLFEAKRIPTRFALSLLQRAVQYACPVYVPALPLHGTQAQLGVQEQEHLPIVLNSKSEVVKFPERQSGIVEDSA